MPLRVSFFGDVTVIAQACARMGRGRLGLIRGCLSPTSRRYPHLLSGCRVVCRGDKHGNAPFCNKQERTAADVRFDRLALAQDPALALKLSPAASPCTRPLMASSLKKSKVGQGRRRRAEAVRSSPQATSPQPGDQPPCLHCLSMQTGAPWCAWACVCPLLCVCARMRVFRSVRCWCVCVSLGAGMRAWVLVCECARVCLHISPRISQN